jgi:hypothetical protein
MDERKKRLWTVREASEKNSTLEKSKALMNFEKL